MALFRYRAVTEGGKNLKGVIDADSLVVAKERLRKQQILVIDVLPIGGREKQLVLQKPMLLNFTRELALLLRAGLPLYESLVTIEEKYARHPCHSLFLDLCDRLKEGSSFSAALKRYPQSFDRIYLSMVQVAEESGNMADVIEQLFQLISRQQKLKKQLFSALAYPAFLASFCGLIVCGLLFFVIPSMKELFDGRTLHPVTMTVLAVSNAANNHAGSIVSVFLITMLAVVFLGRTPKGKMQLYQLSLRIPFVKTLLLHSALVRFCRALAMLLEGGVPLLEALSLARNVVKSPLLESAIEQAEKKVIQGERLSAAFQGAPLIPHLVLRMLALAEETGKMGEAFLNLTEIYEQEMEKHLGQLNTFLQPALLITLGGIVGLVVLSILLPLTDVSSFSAS